MNYPLNLLDRIPYIDRSEESLAITLRIFDDVVRFLFKDQPELEEYIEFVYRQGHTQKEYCTLKHCSSYHAQKLSSDIRYRIARYQSKTLCFSPFILIDNLEKKISINNQQIAKLQKENEELLCRLQSAREEIL